MKLYDFDGMFDEKISEYISKNQGKYSEEEWEDLIPKLYQKFGDTQIKSIGNTPRGFYSAMSAEELVKCLRAHLKQGVPVSEFLCSAIEENPDAAQYLLPLLDGTRDECGYAMNLIGADESVIEKYLDMLVAADDEDLKARCAELIREKADLVTDKLIGYFKAGKEREYMLELLSRSQNKCDGVFEILLNEFRGDPENVPVHAGYLAAYGDARALEYLLDKIDEDGISFVEFQELKFAIEALGGEYKKERDFSDDPYYKLIHEN